MNNELCTNSQIIDEAKVIYDKLPRVLQIEIDEYLEQGTNLVLSTKFDVLTAYLEWEGINGHEDDLMKIFKAMM